MNLNRVLIVGHLTRSPEVRMGQNGTAVARFGVATNTTWTDEHGEKREEVEFHNVVAFGRQAETAGEYLRKGQLVLVEGRLQTSSWTTEGMKRSRTDIVATRLQFGPKRLEEPSSAPDVDDQLEEEAVVIPPLSKDSEPPVMNDDLPF